MMDKFVIAPHFRLQEWVAEEKGYFARRRPRLRVPARRCRSTSGAAHQLGNKVGAYQTIEAGPHLRCQRRLPLDGERRRRVRPRQALCRCLFGLARRRFRAAGIRRSRSRRIWPACRSRSAINRAAITRRSRRSSSTCRSTEIKLSFDDGLLFSRMEQLFDRKVPAVAVFSGPYYFLEQLGFRKVHRHHLHDGDR